LWAPVNTSKRRCKRKKKKTGVIAPLAMHVNSPRKKKRFVRKIARTISQNAGGWN
jgi:hypothetical protein